MTSINSKARGSKKAAATRAPAVNFQDFGYLRTAAVAPVLALANPAANAKTIIKHLRDLEKQKVAIALFPELCLTGYSCEDLFFSTSLREQVVTALNTIAKATTNIIAVVGAPWRTSDDRLLNVGVVLAGGQVRGMVPKTAHPNYGEFYERRWFVAADDLDEELTEFNNGARISRQQIFQCGERQFAVEICEDLWAPDSPGTAHSLAGAELTLNLSASNELVSKANYRRDLVRMTSAQRICGYLYASSGAMESSKDVVFGGHCLAAESGALIGESERFSLDAQQLIVDFDFNKLGHDRLHNNSFMNARRPGGYRRVVLNASKHKLTKLTREYPPHPFVPSDIEHRDANASEILNIQATGLARRMLAARTQGLVIGLSGGLDSTLAFLVCLAALSKLNLPLKNLHALTLPGPGTSKKTKTNAHALAEAAGVALKEISIAAAVKQHLADLEHQKTDVVFENAQARERTQILFNYANKVGGIVVGTGDLSELALGWCTYNADQMANYNVNASVPKTLVSSLVNWYARERSNPKLAKVLGKVLDTPISPELLPLKGGEIAQETEAIIGPYELHDFFLHHWLRNGFTPSKIFHLALAAFHGSYSRTVIKKWLRLFFARFFSQQFKRTTAPPGPKVGSVSLSPRGDWRMPDEADASAILAEIDAL